MPGGFKFQIPILHWSPPPNTASFDSVVRSAIAVLQANPQVAQQLGWDLSYNSMADRVDTFNATLCEQMQWTAYYTGRPGGAPSNGPFMTAAPPPPPPLPGLYGVNVAANRFPAPQSTARPGTLAVGMAVIKKLAAGAATLMEWEEAGLPHVEQEKANARGATCAICPRNNAGKNLTDYFTVPLAEMIKKRMERLAELDLKTPSDEKLMVCDACYCPLRTKIWMPIELAVKRLRPEDKAELNKDNPRCWILSESNA
jgi:hypothetical protein